MVEVVEVLARALVDQPDEVEVEETSQRGDTVYLELRVAPGEMGKVIGRQGRIASAIRTVASAAAEKQGLRAIVDIRS
ncbi:MAG TPA: KH domain-containing protein [Armatimonadota bacterium]|nr:KH domain-containing protein [Armatimonadota bacterium]